MRLAISGRPLGQGVNQMLLRKASNYMTGLLLRDDQARLTTIDVELKLIEDFKKEHGIIAECNWLDDPFRPKRFYIDLDAALSHKTTLITLAHELTHIQQMALGFRMETVDGKGIYWMGQLYRPADMHYYDLPWEIDAHGREFGLYDRFVESESGILLSPASIVDETKRLRVA